MPLDPDNSEVQCLASEVKTPDFKKAICGDDDTESEEDICVKSAGTTDPNKHIVKCTQTSFFNSPESLPSPQQNKVGKKRVVLDGIFRSPPNEESYTQQLQRTACVLFILVRTHECYQTISNTLEGAAFTYMYTQTSQLLRSVYHPKSVYTTQGASWGASRDAPHFSVN